MHWSLRLKTSLRLSLECTVIFAISRTLGPVPAYYFAEYYRLIRTTRTKYTNDVQ
jgi:hypothetical protein